MKRRPFALANSNESGRRRSAVMRAAEWVNEKKWHIYSMKILEYSPIQMKNEDFGEIDSSVHQWLPIKRVLTTAKILSLRQVRVSMSSHVKGAQACPELSRESDTAEVL